MDNLTHSLFALTVARTPLGRGGRGSTAVLVLASNAPDADIVTATGQALSYLQWHRGPTHGPLGIVGLGLLAAAIVWVADRRFQRQPSSAAPFGRLAALGIAGVLGHVLMDLPTSYGTRLLSPFDWHWFTTDWMPIVDIYLVGILAAGMIFGHLRSDRLRRPREHALASAFDSRSRNAIIALLLMTANYGVRVVAHHEALRQAPDTFGSRLPERCSVPAERKRIVERWPPSSSAQPGPVARCLIDIAAIPTFTSPFQWRLIAHMSDGYEVRDLDLFHAGGAEAALRGGPRLSITYPNRWTPAVFVAAETHVARTFLGFARFPAVRSVTSRDGSTIVRWTDLRFVNDIGRTRPGFTERGFFTATVRLDAAGAAAEERLGP